MKTKIMKIAIVALWISSISVCTAQDTRDEIQIGVKAGVNYSNVYDAKGEDFKADGKLGGVIGAFLSIPIGEYLGLQPEVLFSQKGFNGKGKILGTPYEFSRTTTYLDVPVYFALKPSPVITILGGPQFSYVLSKKDTFGNGTTTIAQEQEFENENFRKNRLSASLGFDVNVNQLVFGARANWDLQENQGDGTSTTPRYKNQWLQATVGFRF
jgi:hypothetical protein